MSSNQPNYEVWIACRCMCMSVKYIFVRYVVSMWYINQLAKKYHVNLKGRKHITPANYCD